MAIVATVQREGDGSGLLRRLAEVAMLNGLGIEAGITSAQVAAGESDGPRLVEIATTLEFGSQAKRIPARPWMRGAVDKYGKVWADKFAKSLSIVTRGGSVEQAEQGVRVTGLVMVADIQESLGTGDWQANAESTVRSKWERAGEPGTLESFAAQNRPLKDTGQLLQSHRAVLVDAKGKYELIG